MAEPVIKPIASPKRHSLIWLQIAALFFVLAPVLGVGLFSYLLISKQFDDLILARRPTIAFLAATVVEARLDGITDFGTSLASRVRFRELVEAGEWDEAIAILENVPQEYAYVDRLVLFDTSGTAMSDTPALSDVIGTNFAYRDWYQGVTRDWKPYLSEVYLRTAEPMIRVISLAVPVIKDDGSPAAILLIQLRLESFVSLTKRINIGHEGYVSIVDQNGHIVAHPLIDSAVDVRDYSGQALVRWAMEGRSGITVAPDPFDGEEKVIAYAGVPKYGWGVIVGQTTRAAFAEKHQQLRFIAYAYLLALMLALGFAYVIARFFRLYQEFRERESAFLESIGEGVIATDEHGTILFMNSTAASMLGWKKEEVIGNIWDEDLPKAVDEKGNPIPLENRAMQMAFKSKDRVTASYDYLRKDGSRLPVSVTAAPIIPSNRIVGSVVVFRDVTEERKLDRAKTEFVSLASHQLRTPMTAMKWFIDLLLAEDLGRLTVKQKETIKDLAIINKNMVDLVTGLLNVARIELNTYTIDPQPVSLPEVADSVLSEQLLLISEKKLTIEKHYESSLPPVNADASLIRVLLQNLINNAIKYTPPGGTIIIAIEWRVEAIEITVSDTGYGIPKDQQSRIFSKMFRADNIKSKVVEGTGLGLYAVKAIVDEAGGKIWFESEQDKGTTFHVTMPMSGMKKKEGTSRLS